MNRVAFLSILLGVFCFPAQAADDDEKRFKGLYFGADGDFLVGDQQYFAGHLGYRYQFGVGLVVGAELGSAKYSAYDADPGEVTLKEARLVENAAASFSGILGYAFGDKRHNMIYVAGGFAEFPDDLEEFSNDYEGTGVRYAVGYERSVNKILHFRAQMVQATYNELYDIRSFKTNRTNFTLGITICY